MRRHHILFLPLKWNKQSAVVKLYMEFKFPYICLAVEILSITNLQLKMCLKVHMQVV